MPSEESLRKQEYYGHRANQFWRLIFAVFSKEYTELYKEKIELINNLKIALWDVLKSCEGKWSSDTSITNEQANDFKEFYSKYPNIHTIVFSSKKAEEFYTKYIGKTADKNFLTLPSPSSANAKLSFKEKLEKWQILYDIIKQ